MENIESLVGELKIKRMEQKKPTKDTIIELYKFLESFKSNKEASLAVGASESTVQGWASGKRIPSNKYAEIMEKISKGKVSANKIRGRE